MILGHYLGFGSCEGLKWGYNVHLPEKWAWGEWNGWGGGSKGKFPVPHPHSPVPTLFMKHPITTQDDGIEIPKITPTLQATYTCRSCWDIYFFHFRRLKIVHCIWSAHNVKIFILQSDPIFYAMNFCEKVFDLDKKGIFYENLKFLFSELWRRFKNMWLHACFVLLIAS